MNALSGAKIIPVISAFATLIFYPITSSAGPVSIMSYNVDNLFDSSHDDGKKDYTFLPRAEKTKGSPARKYCRSLSWNRAWMWECYRLDWTDSAYKRKLQNIASVIRSYNEGKGPDIAVIVEVENMAVLDSLVELWLSDLGYDYRILIEGEDERGIDIGLISRFPPSSDPILHGISLEALSEDSLRKSHRASATRGILEVPLKINSRVVTVMANHWPSPGSRPITRMIAGRNLRLLYESKPRNSLIVALGDFNVVEEEYPNAIETHLTVPGPKGSFLDAYSHCRFIESPSCAFPQGTSYYRGWDMLDRVFLSSHFLTDKGVEFSWVDFMIYAPAFIRRDDDTPLRYSATTGKGYSDHFPVVMEFDLK